MNQYYVYILKCSDNTYYTGVTNNLEKRFAEHNTGTDPKSYTFKRRPVSLFHFETFGDINQAIQFEKQVKGWSRKKKEALAEGNWEKIKKFAECQNESHYMRNNVPLNSDDETG